MNKSANENIDSNADIIVVASCNVDLISYAERMPKLGETLMGKEFKMGFGGKGANKAIACSRLGSNCSVISKLGNDVFGRDYIENLKNNGIKTDHVFITDKAATGVAPIFVDENGNNSILVILGANLLLSKSDINSCENLIKNSKILITNLEIPVETVEASLKIAKSNNVTTILNFAPANTNLNPGIFFNTDYLILNEVETEQLSKIPIKSSEDAIKASLSLLDNYQIQNGILVTLGEKGVLYTDRKTRKSLHKKGPSVKVVDTSGAGDAFCGAFVHYLNKLGENSIDKVVELSNEYASLTVQSLGTQSSYPHLKVLDQKFYF